MTRRTVAPELKPSCRASFCSHLITVLRHCFVCDWESKLPHQIIYLWLVEHRKFTLRSRACSCRFSWTACPRLSPSLVAFSRPHAREAQTAEVVPVNGKSLLVRARNWKVKGSLLGLYDATVSSWKSIVRNRTKRGLYMCFEIDEHCYGDILDEMERYM